jgi:hypothetical protein
VPFPRSPPPGQVSGNAARQGVEDFTKVVKAVDFTAFVSGLIEGVFTSIVDSSIRQMEAYGELVAAVAKSVDQFGQENFTDEDVRQHLVGNFPRAIEREGPRLRLREGLEDAQKPDLAAFAGLSEEVSLDDEEGEKKLLAAVRRKMAEGRQKQLATMVLMGINRIVVTDGKINAKVMFDVKAKETSDFAARAARSDSSESRNAKVDIERRGSIWGTRGTSVSSDVTTKVSTADATSSQKSHEEIQTRAQLSGEVTVNFKSETFPLEKIASMDQMGAIQTRGGGPR